MGSSDVLLEGMIQHRMYILFHGPGLEQTIPTSQHDSETTKHAVGGPRLVSFSLVLFLELYSPSDRATNSQRPNQTV